MCSLGMQNDSLCDFVETEKAACYIVFTSTKPGGGPARGGADEL